MFYTEDRTPERADNSFFGYIIENKNFNLLVLVGP